MTWRKGSHFRRRPSLFWRSRSPRPGSSSSPGLGRTKLGEGGGHKDPDRSEGGSPRTQRRKLRDTHTTHVTPARRSRWRVIYKGYERPVSNLNSLVTETYNWTKEHLVSLSITSNFSERTHLPLLRPTSPYRQESGPPDTSSGTRHPPRPWRHRDLKVDKVKKKTSKTNNERKNVTLDLTFYGLSRTPLVPKSVVVGVSHQR